VANGRERREIFFGELKKAHGWLQRRPCFGCAGCSKLLLQMNKGAGSLDQSLEVICIARIGFEPKLFENVVRFVVTPFVPAPEKGVIKWMLFQRQRFRSTSSCPSSRRKREILSPLFMEGLT